MSDDINPTTPAENATSELPIEQRIEQALYGQPEETPTAAEVEETEEVEGNAEDLSALEPTDESNESEADDEPENLASYLGLTEDQIAEEDGKIYVNAKVNGETSKVALADLIKGYQTEKAVTQKSQALAEERKAWEQQAQAAQQAYEQKIQQADTALGILEKQLVGRFEAVDWDKLRADDPAEWAAKRQEMAQQYQEMKRAKEAVGARQKEAIEQQQQQQAQQQAAYLQQQSEMMLADNPSWNDAEVKQRELGEIREFLQDAYGFNEQDLSHVTDHRLVRLIQDAQAYRKVKKAADPKKAKPIPKFVKKGAGRNIANERAKQAKQKHARLKKSGSIQDAAALLMDRM
jgi:hypothetical protein